jgi:hypothetical protein
MAWLNEFVITVGVTCLEDEPLALSPSRQSGSSGLNIKRMSIDRGDTENPYGERDLPS